MNASTASSKIAHSDLVTLCYTCIICQFLPTELPNSKTKIEYFCSNGKKILIFIFHRLIRSLISTNIFSIFFCFGLYFSAFCYYFYFSRMKWLTEHAINSSHIKKSSKSIVLSDFFFLFFSLFSLISISTCWMKGKWMNAMEVRAEKKKWTNKWRKNCENERVAHLRGRKTFSLYYNVMCVCLRCNNLIHFVYLFSNFFRISLN